MPILAHRGPVSALPTMTCQCCQTNPINAPRLAPRDRRCDPNHCRRMDGTARPAFLPDPGTVPRNCRIAAPLRMSAVYTVPGIAFTVGRWPRWNYKLDQCGARLPSATRHRMRRIYNRNGARPSHTDDVPVMARRTQRPGP